MGTADQGPLKIDNLTKSDPLDVGPKSIFPPKDAAKGRNMLDSFFVGKISYYMVTPTTSFCTSEVKLKKLMGETGV